MNRKFETDRLILKIPDKSDAGAVLEYYLRNQNFLRDWEPLRTPEFYTLRYHAEQLEADLQAYELQSDARFWLFKKEQPDRAVGCLAFNNIVRYAFLSCFLSYKSDAEEQCQGYITEAARKGIDIMFNTFGLHRIEANILPRNAASLRVVEKLGFNNEGLAKKYLKINGIWEDHIHMVLLNEKMD